MSNELSDKIALVTGGTRGIGKAIAQSFASAGAQVFISGRDAQTGEAAATELNARFVACDVTDPASIERMFQQIGDDAGGLDILVNNAGGASGFAPVAEMSDDMWLELLNLDLNSVFRCSRAALAMMMPRGGGRIINISSVEGKHGKPGMAHYVAAKHGVNGFTKALSKEVGAAGITVNAICPGLVITDLIRNQSRGLAEANNMDVDEFLAIYAKEAAIGRPIEADEVAAMVLMLASPAGAGVSGACISVDGGTAAY